MSRRGLTLVEVIFLLLLLAFIIAVILPIFDHSPGISKRAQCASNLHQIGVALTTYGGDHNEQFPSVPIRASLQDKARVIGTDINWKTKTNGGQSPWRDLVPSGQDNPYARDQNNQWSAPATTPTVSASLWLLCRYNMATPKLFICPSDRVRMAQDDPDTRPACSSDFYTHPKAGTLISYSFLPPWSAGWCMSLTPGMIIAGDENNGSQPNYWTSRGKPEQKDVETYANSTNHKGQGQNVLAVDGSTKLADSPYCGINDDNVYTALPKNYTGGASDTQGVLWTRPRDTSDTVLIPNREANLARWDRTIVEEKPVSQPSEKN